jgi:predicted RNA-binding Zn ribbon-like protein
VEIEELQRQVEYKFAPAPLLAVQALANTYSYEDGEERLLDAASAKRWLVDSGLAAAGVVVGDAELESLRALRGAVRTLIGANLAESADGGNLDAAAALLAGRAPALIPGGDGELTLDLEPARSVEEFAGQIAGIIFRSQLNGEWGRLKICASDDCRWAFFDASRNRGGTWCQMEVCGNRVKNRRYRARAHAAGSAG